LFGQSKDLSLLAYTVGSCKVPSVIVNSPLRPNCKPKAGHFHDALMQLRIETTMSASRYRGLHRLVRLEIRVIRAGAAGLGHDRWPWLGWARCRLNGLGMPDASLHCTAIARVGALEACIFSVKTPSHRNFDATYNARQRKIPV